MSDELQHRLLLLLTILLKSLYQLFDHSQVLYYVLSNAHKKQEIYPIRATITIFFFINDQTEKYL